VAALIRKGHQPKEHEVTDMEEDVNEGVEEEGTEVRFLFACDWHSRLHPPLPVLTPRPMLWPAGCCARRICQRGFSSSVGSTAESDCR
jgi:hypothetical protein